MDIVIYKEQGNCSSLAPSKSCIPHGPAILESTEGWIPICNWIENLMLSLGDDL